MSLEKNRLHDNADSGANDRYTRDRLEYVADLLAELQGVVAPAANQTLTGLLILSEAEARRIANLAPATGRLNRD